ncbi:hypothetical protein [Promicromonospora sukumoe]|uniref:hypothetical protein n=1 Tax=Promicromonospora sukumoe TaxID=88382 RepID=UPI00365D534A
MSALAVTLVGLLLLLAGSLSVRLAVLAAGFGVSWMLAVALGTDTGTAVLVGVAGAVLAFLLTLVASRLLFFVCGLCVGAVVGARLFVLVQGGTADVLLALIVIPAVALLCAFLARRLERRFLVWGTAVGGAALVISGVGRLWTDADDLWHPESGGAVVVALVLWLVLSVIGSQVQKRFTAARFTENG